MQTDPIPLPEPGTTTSVAPIPTVIPGTPVYQSIDKTGARTLWVVVVLMALSSLVFYTLAARAPLSKRFFHILVSIATTVSFIVYLALATGQGITWKHDLIREHHKHVPNVTDEYYRQVFWLRYLNWFLTEPLILANLALLSGLPGAHLLSAVVADYVMLGSGLLGTFAGHTARRWAWFAISAIGYLTTVYHIGINGSRAASNKDVQIRRFFGTISAVSLFVKVLYPVAIAAGPLALKMNVNAETVIFAIYDIFTQGIIGYWLLIAHDSSPALTLLVDGFWSNGIGNEGSIRIEEEGA
ncbi:family A G protein-coupled receptor-like protein [Aspergillus floccosus]